ncbi:unnamed protein product [Closterium sp. Yama58-4]|nr:unnamed protein product [Closterium sp. Yama58-4]
MAAESATMAAESATGSAVNVPSERTTRATAERLASEGYGVYGIDFEGHGRSDGLSVFIPDFNTLVDDSIAYFAPHTGASGAPEHTQVHVWGIDGRGSGDLHPPQAARLMGWRHFHGSHVQDISQGATTSHTSAAVEGTGIVPAADIVTSAIRCPEKLKKIAANPYTYRARPRMRTALTMLHASQDAESSLSSISLPFLLLHGDADTVTELDGSQALYEKARSEDKTLKVYEGAWHLLTEGEPEETAEKVLCDMIGWLDERSQRKSSEFSR